MHNFAQKSDQMHELLLNITHNSPDRLMEWVIIPGMIFLARIMDVSISTLRMMFMINERRGVATLLGFIEVLIWLVAVGQALQHLSNVFSYLAFAGGFATGTYVGMIIEKKLAVGLIMLRVVTVKADSHELIEYLRGLNYTVTSVDAEGNEGHVNVIFLAAPRKKLPELVNAVKRFNPNALYTIENLRFVSNLVPSAVRGVMPGGRK